MTETYRLVFVDDGDGPKTVEFDATDAGSALVIAHEEAKRRSAELWRGDDKLCTIKRLHGVSGEEFWQVGPGDITG
ncbi:hypothetical protein GCM10011371_07150 [Novosphingobium marinum]|uniref:Uncharacterized protein n=1 Tax=Novosphingobium marinum TaxID=1514948 RepID=A0A7Z0BUP8_9SPHN|nr:hypothetical protein [Novosphingobium marinum]NYH94402.1 hypothetical protein [Novosphingobium marinum]GGC22083.1 hypothetical protein GCM10011371_07150 [Novosphingobium marinum]